MTQLHTPREAVDIDVALVRRLLAAQFPHWADLPIRRVDVDGWDNRTFRLGDHMSVRLPSARRYAAQVEKEQRWLPRLAPLLPLRVPEPLALGLPGEGCPWHWSVYRWIDGETAAVGPIGDRRSFAADLAAFLTALRQIDPTDGPPPGPHNFQRGASPSVYAAETRHALAKLHARIDTAAADSVWEAALAACWDGQPVWLHGDVAATNLLVRDGRLSAVIDFGCSAVGDPACDLVIAWTFFTGESREAFRAAADADAGTWARARGWCLWKALITLAKHDDPAAPEAAEAHRVIGEVLSDRP